MIRGLGASLVAAAVLATTAGARCLDSATAAFGQPGAFGVGVRDLTLVDDTRPTPAHGSQPALPMRTLVTRTELYRNWRIDLLSYRISTGWRPLVLVKGPAVSLTPDTPSLLWGTFRSKTEADRYALHAAREWIDKHSGE